MDSHDQVGAFLFREELKAEGFAQNPFVTVSLMRLADLSSDDQPQTGVPQVIGVDADRYLLSPIPSPFFKNPGKLFG